MVGAHRDDTGPHKSLEEAVLENIDKAAETATQPAQQAFIKIQTMQRIIVAGMVFVVFFAATTTYSLIRINNIADENQDYLVSGCNSGNEARASELSFWLAIFADTADDPEAKTKKGVAQREFYLDKLYDTYPQLDCTKVKSGLRVVIPPNKTTKSTQ